MINKIQSGLDKFRNDSQQDALSTFLAEPEKLEPVFNYVDQRVEKTTSQIRKEINQTIKEFRQEMKETMAEYNRQKMITLLINIAIAAFAWLGFLFNRLMCACPKTLHPLKTKERSPI